MQTFLPYPDFEQSARCLDRLRLGKQRVEVYQILRGQWRHHPASKMWQGHFYGLGMYGKECCLEWIRRGYEDSLFIVIQNLKRNFNEGSIVPPWFGNEAFHSSHRAALLYKNYEWYKQFNWSEEPALNYVWPTKVGLM